MDHTRISGTEPSSVILSQKVFIKVKKDVQNVPKQAKAKWDGVINTISNNFNTEKFDAQIKRGRTLKCEGKILPNSKSQRIL